MKAVLFFSPIKSGNSNNSFQPLDRHDLQLLSRENDSRRECLLMFIGWNLWISCATCAMCASTATEQHAQRGILAWQERSTHFIRCSANGRVSSWCFLRATFYLLHDNRLPRCFSPSFFSISLSSSRTLKPYETGSFFRVFDHFSTCHATLSGQETILHLRSLNFSGWSSRSNREDFVSLSVKKKISQTSSRSFL